MAEVDPKEIILDELKKGKKAIKETVRLYKLLEKIDVALVENSRLIPSDINKELKKMCRERDNGEIFKKGDGFFWKGK